MVVDVVNRSAEECCNYEKEHEALQKLKVNRYCEPKLIQSLRLLYASALRRRRPGRFTRFSRLHWAKAPSIGS